MNMLAQVFSSQESTPNSVTPSTQDLDLNVKPIYPKQEKKQREGERNKSHRYKHKNRSTTPQPTRYGITTDVDIVVLDKSEKTNVLPPS